MGTTQTEGGGEGNDGDLFAPGSQASRRPAQLEMHVAMPAASPRNPILGRVVVTTARMLPRLVPVNRQVEQVETPVMAWDLPLDSDILIEALRSIPTASLRKMELLPILQKAMRVARTMSDYYHLVCEGAGAQEADELIEMLKAIGMDENDPERPLAAKGLE